jgi:hypothetical protein
MAKEGAFTVHKDASLLIFSGVCVGVVTIVFTCNLEYNWEKESHTTMKILQYNLQLELRRQPNS